MMQGRPGDDRQPAATEFAMTESGAGATPTNGLTTESGELSDDTLEAIVGGLTASVTFERLHLGPFDR
jgi:hypothetical protein